MDRKKRPARLLGLVLIWPLAVTGCRTIVPTKPAAAPSAPPSPQQAARPSAQNNSPGALVKNDFHRMPTQDQRFNVHIELGKQYMREQQFEPALLEFKKALEACNHSSGLRGGSHRIDQQVLARRKIGAAQMSLGKGTEAENELKLASKLAPNDPRVWNDLGYMYSMHQKFTDAEQCLRRALKLDPDSPLVRQNLGFAVAYQGRTAEGLELLTQAGGKANGHTNMGFVLARQGRMVEARDEYRKALEVEPKLTKAREALAQLDHPKSPEPFGAVAADKAVLAPSAAAPASSMLAMPAPTPLAAPTAVASASPRLAPAATAVPQPRPAAASEVKLQPPQVTGIPRPSPATSPVDTGLRPTSFGATPAGRPAPAASTRTGAVPAPVKVGTLPTPVPAVVRTARPARTPVPAAATRLVPVPRAQVDVELRPTSYGTIAPAKAASPVSAPAAGARTVPAPAAAPAKPAAPQTANSELFPPPIPAHVDAVAGSGNTKPGATPSPVPMSRHVAVPTLERSGNPTSVPAADAQLVRLPSAG